MQLGIIFGVVGPLMEEKPALISYAPLSIIRVLEGGGGPEDLVRGLPGAMVVNLVLWKKRLKLTLFF